MDIKKYKASLQLAKMRLDVDASQTNQAVYDQALEAYEACQKEEGEKIAQVSGDSGNTKLPGGTATTNKAAVKPKPAAEPKPKAEKVKPLPVKVEAPVIPEGTTQTGDASGQTGDADHTDENSDPAEKKTEGLA